jgi:hypothetical protein
MLRLRASSRPHELRAANRVQLPLPVHLSVRPSCVSNLPFLHGQLHCHSFLCVIKTFQKRLIAFFNAFMPFLPQIPDPFVVLSPFF